MYLVCELKANAFFKAFVSSFAGDGVDVAAMRSAAGRTIMFVPNFHPGQGNFALIDGALNWSVSKPLAIPRPR
jgi:hypothetical protein